MRHISEIAQRVGSMAAIAAFGSRLPPVYRELLSKQARGERHKQQARALGCSDAYIEQFDRAAIAYAQATTDDNFTIYLGCYGLLISRLSAGERIDPINLSEWARESFAEMVMAPYLLLDTLHNLPSEMAKIRKLSPGDQRGEER